MANCAAMDPGPTRKRRTHEIGLNAYVGFVVVTAATLCCSWIYWYGAELDLPVAVGTAVLSAFMLLGVVLSVKVSEQADMGTWDVGLVLAVVVLGPTWASLAVVPVALYVAGRDRLRCTFELGQGVIIAHLAGMVFSMVSAPLLTAEGIDPATAFYGAIATGAALVAANEIINGGLLKVKYGQGFAEVWEQIWRPYLASDAVNILTASLGVLAFSLYGPGAALVVIIGATGSRMMVHRSREHKEEVGWLRHRNASLERALLTSNAAFGTVMVRELGRKDGYTHRHAAATSVYARDLAREMGLDDDHAERLRLAGLVHNIGLFGLPEELLLETGKLNSVAWNRVAEHPARAQEILGSVAEYETMACWVRWHHEREDGTGYPDRLRGGWIPLEAKILAASETYASLVLDGPHSPGLTPQEARRELAGMAGGGLDGHVVRSLLRVLDAADPNYAAAVDARFAPPDAPPDLGGSGESRRLGSTGTEDGS